MKIEKTGLEKINYGSLEYASIITLEHNPVLNTVEFPLAKVDRLAVSCEGSLGELLPHFSGPSNAKSIFVTGCGIPLGDARTVFGIKTMIGETVAAGAESNFLFKDNTFRSIGFPNLTRIDGELSFTRNSLVDFVFPALRTVNGGMSFNEQHMRSVNQSAFPVLVNVTKFLKFSGPLSE